MSFVSLFKYSYEVIDNNIPKALKLEQRKNLRETALNDLLFSMIPACGFNGSEQECRLFARQVIDIMQIDNIDAETELKYDAKQNKMARPMKIASIEKFQVRSHKFFTRNY